ncbi:hypothetical protein [Caminibacter pacificus]
MREIVITACLVCSLFGFTCEELFKKFHTPDPKTKTMKQLKRWAKAHLKNNPYKEDILECLIENAADNPNQETIAAE